MTDFTEIWIFYSRNLIFFSVFGVDTVSLEDLWATANQADFYNVTDKLEISPFVDFTVSDGEKVPSIIFPKFNNYPIRDDFENHLAEAVIPFNVAGLKDFDGKFCACSKFFHQKCMMKTFHSFTDEHLF